MTARKRQMLYYTIHLKKKQQKKAYHEPVILCYTKIMEHTCHSIDTLDAICTCGTPYTVVLYCCGDREPDCCHRCQRQRAEELRQAQLAEIQNREHARRAENAKNREAWRRSIASELEKRRKK